MNYSILLLSLFAVLVTGCQQREISPKQRWKEQTLVFNIFEEPPTLDPTLAIDSSSAIILHLLFEPLVRKSDGDILEPAAAERIDVSDDAKTYTFHIRKALWSNGDPVTAHDFAFAWKRSLDPSFPGEASYRLYLIKGAREAKDGKKSLDDVSIHAIDDNTLVVELENPTAYFLELLEEPCYLPVNRTVINHKPNWALDATPDYVCNGPFQINEWAHHNQLVLVKNPRYWDVDSVKLNKVTMLMIGDSHTELALFERQAIDWAGRPFMNLPIDAMPALINSGRLETHPLSAVYFYILNVEKVPFTNVNIRRAFANAIDRKAIVDNITQGKETIATCLTAPPLSLQQQRCFEYDISLANQFLDLGLQELGLTKEQLPEITISYNTSDTHHKIAQAIQQNWKATLGIDVKLKNLEWKVHLDALSGGNFTVARMTRTAHYADPHTFLEVFKNRHHHSNLSRWSDPEYTALLAEAEQTTDSTHRLALLKQAELRLIDQMPVIPIFFAVTSFVRNPHLRGLYFSPIGWVDFKTAYFDVD